MGRPRYTSQAEQIVFLEGRLSEYEEALSDIACRNLPKAMSPERVARHALDRTGNSYPLQERIRDALEYAVELRLYLAKSGYRANKLLQNAIDSLNGIK